MLFSVIQNKIRVYCSSRMSCVQCFKIKFDQSMDKITTGLNTYQKIYDPVKEKTEDISTGTCKVVRLSKVYFLFPFALFSLNLLDTFLQALLSPYHFRSNPHLLSHKILPFGFWQHGDVIVLLGLAMATINYGIILWTPFIDQHLQMKAFVEVDSRKELHLREMTMNSQRIPTPLAEKIYQTHVKTARMINLVFLITTVEMNSLFIWQLVAKFSLSLRNIAQMLNVPILFLFGGWGKA